MSNNVIEINACPWWTNFWQGLQDHYIWKELSFQWIVLGQLDLQIQGNHSGPLPQNIQKKFKMNQRLKCKQFLNKNNGKPLWPQFLNMSPQVQVTK